MGEGREKKGEGDGKGGEGYGRGREGRGNERGKGREEMDRKGRVRGGDCFLFI